MRRPAFALAVALATALLAGCGDGEGSFRVAPLPLPDWAEPEVDPGYRLAGGVRVEQAGEPRRLSFLYEVWRGESQVAVGQWGAADLTAPADLVLRIDAGAAAFEAAVLHPEAGIPMATAAFPLPAEFPVEGRGIATAILVGGAESYGAWSAAPVFGVRRGPTITPASGFDGPFHADETVLVVRLQLEP